ncbi:hypothetical protein JL720_1878 [Aureococcus anophagefferens]|nr:hypothetical protein JL720_1878 [Aureococcus anophagefferens]
MLASASPLLRRGAAAGAALVAAAAYTGNEYREWLALRDDAVVAEKDLPPTRVAQRSRVVSAPGALSAAALAKIEAWHRDHERSLGSTGRTESNGSAAFKTGAWETTAVLRADAATQQPLLAQNGGPIDAGELQPRTIERHTVRPGGSLPYPEHHDAGSVYTIDVLLVDPDEFGGGDFSTLEADGTMREHRFGAAGDAFVFQSHKYHCVAPVTRGERRVLVVEFWIGEARTCAHRCEHHFAPCDYTATVLGAAANIAGGTAAGAILIPGLFRRF